MNAHETFIKGPHKQAFEELIQKEALRVGIEYALLVMVQNQPLFAEPSQGWDHHSKLAGAREFIEILGKLHLPKETRKTSAFPNLQPPS